MFFNINIIIDFFSFKELYILLKIAVKYIGNVTDLITAVVRLLQRDINGLVETALGELKLVKT